MTLPTYTVRAVCAVLIVMFTIATCIAAPAHIYAQSTGSATEQPAIDSPLLPTVAPATPQPTATPSPLPPPSPTATPSVTPTETASPMPTATATLDLAAAALQVSPLRITADDRPIAASSAMLWIALAVVIVMAGASVMVVARQREDRR